MVLKKLSLQELMEVMDLKATKWDMKINLIKKIMLKMYKGRLISIDENIREQAEK